MVKTRILLSLSIPAFIRPLQHVEGTDVEIAY